MIFFGFFIQLYIGTSSILGVSYCLPSPLLWPSPLLRPSRSEYIFLFLFFFYMLTSALCITSLASRLGPFLKIIFYFSQVHSSLHYVLPASHRFCRLPYFLPSRSDYILNNFHIKHSALSPSHIFQCFLDAVSFSLREMSLIFPFHLYIYNKFACFSITSFSNSECLRAA